MSLTVGELQVLLSGDPSKLNRDLDRIDARAGQTERTHSAAWGRIGAAAGAAIRSGMIVATGAVVGLGAAIKQGLNMANFTEQAEISFGTLLGSAEAAKTYMVDLQKFAATTPFELPGVVEGAQKLLGVGAAVETVLPTLTAWGDASGALGLNQEKFGRVLTAVTQMMGKGKVSAEEMLQITEAGIPIWMLMAKATGKPIAELQKLASEGKLLAEDVLPALEAQMNADYGGSMAKQAQTLSGVWSTAKDNLNLALRDAVLPLSAGLKTVLPGASAAAATAIRELGLRGSEGLVNLIKRGQELRQEFGPELAELGEIAAQKWGQFVDLLGELGSAVAPSLPSLIDSLIRIAQVGAEVGEAMLPALEAGLRLAGPAAGMLSGALIVVADVLETIQPILPLVVGGFMAFKALGAISGVVGSVATALRGASGALQVYAQNMALASYQGGLMGASAGKVSTVVSGLGKALPALAIVTAGAAAAFSIHANAIQDFGDRAFEAYNKLGQGGAAADRARRELTMLREAAEKGPSTFLWFGNEHTDALNEAEAKYRQIQSELTPLEKAQQKVAMETNNLQLALQNHGVGSEQAAAASRNLRTAQTDLEGKQRDLANATQTATDKLIAQAQQAMAAASADLALRQSRLGVQQAQEQYNAVMADGTATAAQRTAAEQALEGSYYSAAQAAAAKAVADNAGKAPAEQSAAAVAAQLQVLQDMAAAAGGQVPAAVAELIASLQASGGTAMQTAAKMAELKLSVIDIPDNKHVVIDAPTEDQKQRLRDLGYTVTNIPGSKNVIVTADTSPAAQALAALVARNYTINVRAVMPDLNGAVSGSGRMGTYGAIGGIVHAYANGGFEPMRGGIAQVVPPNSFRLIGDRVRDDEAYIPINQDKRSLEILALTAKRMGGAFVPNAARRLPAAVGGSTANGHASVGGVTNRNYSWHGYVREEMSDKRFMELAERAEWLHG